MRRGNVCLVREEGGMELSCKKHLDTIYTVYRIHYQGIRGAQRLGKEGVEDPLAKLRREYMQSREELMARPEEKLLEEVTIPGELYGSTRQEHIDAIGTEPPMFMFPSDDIYKPAKLITRPEPIVHSPTLAPELSKSTENESIASKVFEKVPLDAEQYTATMSASGVRTPASTPGSKSTEAKNVEKVLLDAEQSSGLITPVHTPTPTVPPSLSAPKTTPITPSKRKASSNPADTPTSGADVKMVSCSRHAYLVPESELGINHKTRKPFKTCARCRRKNRRMAAILRGTAESDEEWEVDSLRFPGRA
jgi:hypothetical protein